MLPNSIQNVEWGGGASGSFKWPNFPIRAGQQWQWGWPAEPAPEETLDLLDLGNVGVLRLLLLSLATRSEPERTGKNNVGNIADSPWSSNKAVLHPFTSGMDCVCYLYLGKPEIWFLPVYNADISN